MTALVHDARELRATCDGLRQQGRVVGLVPTMGALHEGHTSLVEEARAHGATATVVTIFVNPLQFGEGEDLERYPRTLDRDLRLCRQRGVDLVYAPAAETMYGPDFQTQVEVTRMTQQLEGVFRPTHFRGVTTVVAKLFNAAGPCVAAFGRKDYQQWRVIACMARDLDMPVEVIGCPIVRESDGLAMSSRNRYLDAGQRARATALHRGLCLAREAFAAGERRVAELERLAREPVEAAFDRIDYVALRDAESLEEPTEASETGSVLLMAAHLGTTRLIDNEMLGRSALA